MTKIEMLDKLNRMVCAVEALPNGAEPIAASVSITSEYIHIASYGETLDGAIATEREGEGGPFVEYEANILGVPVIWVGVLRSDDEMV